MGDYINFASGVFCFLGKIKTHINETTIDAQKLYSFLK